MPPKKVKLALKQPETVDEWLAAKVKYPGSYSVSPDGLLIVPPSKSGDSERQIKLNPRVNASNEHIHAMFAARKEQVKEAEDNFTEARRSLQRTILAFNQGLASAGDVVLANQQVKEAESFLIEKAVSPRFVESIVPKPEIREILLENRYLDSRMAGEVYNLRRATFPWTFMYEPRQELIQETAAPVATNVVEEPSKEIKEEIQTAASQAKVGAIIAARKKKLKLPGA
jgi:hypothetical protein